MTDIEEIPGETPSTERSWSRVWQLPSVLLGTGLFVMAVYMLMPSDQPDDFHSMLEDVATSIQARDLAGAEESLRLIQPDIHERADETIKAWYDELWGDLVYFQQASGGGEAGANYEMIVTYYKDAIKRGRTPDTIHRQRLAEALIALGQEDAAIELLGEFIDGESRHRHALLRQVINKRLLAPEVDVEALQATLNRYLDELQSEPNDTIRRSGEIWATALKGRLLFDAGDAKTTIQMVERKLIYFLDRGGKKDTGPLYVLRGKAYQRLGDFDRARESYAIAQKVLPPGDSEHADVLVGFGQIELVQSDDVRQALHYFTVAEQKYRPLVGDPVRSPYMDALIGRSDCEARLGKHVAAVDNLKVAVGLLTESLRPPKDKQDRLVNTALAHHMATSDIDEFETAMQYLTAMMPLYKDAPPSELLAQFALTHERIGTKKLEEAGLSAQNGSPALGGGDPPERLLVASEPTSAVRLIRQDAAQHFELAGDYYRKHSNSTRTIDPQVAGDSTWKSAEMYDKAFRWSRAIAAYKNFIGERGNDPRRLQAIRRLGMAYLADGQYAVAAQKFETLVKDNPNNKETAESLVPLATSLVELQKIEEAVGVLLGVITDHPAITPDSEVYRDALIMLGRLYHRQKDFEHAIEKLATAVQRYGDQRKGATLRYQLAESYRQSVPLIEETLKQPLPQSKVNEYQTERRRRLEQAQVLFSQVVTQLDEISDDERSPVETLYLRNAYFYRADCAFDLKRFEQSIELYDMAIQRWQAHPSSLVALVQTVNAYAELGRFQDAKAANRRAREHLRKIPEEAFDDPSLPMKRKHWQDWLKWSSELNLFDQKATASAADATNTQN